MNNIQVYFTLGLGLSLQKVVNLFPVYYQVQKEVFWQVEGVIWRAPLRIRVAIF